MSDTAIEALSKARAAIEVIEAILNLLVQKGILSQDEFQDIVNEIVLTNSKKYD